MSLQLLSKAYGPSYAGFAAQIKEATTATPARLYTTAAGGSYVSKTGRVVLDANGAFAVFADNRTKFNISVVANNGANLLTDYDIEAGTAVMSAAGVLPVQVTANLVITPTNQHLYAGRVLEMGGTFSITLGKDLVNFSCDVIPNVSGATSVISGDPAVLLDGVTTTQTRLLAANKMFGIRRKFAANTYTVLGS